MEKDVDIQVREVRWNSPEYLQSVDLRYRLFRKPFGLEYSQEELEAEKDQLALGAFLNDRLIGFCMCKPRSSDEYQGRQMVVEPAHQRKGVGVLLVAALENFVREMGAKRIILDARDESVGFYKKQGYLIEGEKFFFKTVDHWKMIKELGV
jgi:GNAT superfamily N-acetyltransferase